MDLEQKTLERAFQKYGLEYRFRSDFASRSNGPSSTSKPLGVICHWTGGPATGNLPSERVLLVGRPGLRGLLCNLALARDGVVVGMGAGLAYHAGVGAWHGITSGNSRLVGIEAESTGAAGGWTPSQITAYPRLVAALADAYGFPVDWIIGHFEWALPAGRKVDIRTWPGGMGALRAEAAALIAAANAPHAPGTPSGGIAPAVPKPGATGRVAYVIKRKLVPDGKFTTHTVKALQKALGVTLDGAYGKRTKVALQRHLGVTADGVIGPVTVRALQRRLGVTVDGKWGQKTTAALQRALNAGKF